MSFRNALAAFALLVLVTPMMHCTNYESALKKNFDFPPPDSTKFNYPDVPSGKMFDLLGSKSTGIDFINKVQFGFMADNNLYVNYYNGAGVAVINYNNDSLPDLYFTGNIVPDRLYVNEGGMRFRDVTEQAGIPLKNKGWSTGVATCDINRDGFEDLYVLRSRWKDSVTNLFYVSNGDGTYTERGKEYGVECIDCYSMGAVFFDADNDGDLDLFVKNHPTDYVERMRFNNLEKIEKGINQSDKFFRNENGKFVDVSKKAGINNHGFGLAVIAADINDDGWMDIYGCNDFAMYDHLYINQKDGTFKDMSHSLLGKVSMFSMGVDIGDINNDGYQDIVTADMRFDHSYLRRSFALGLRRNEFNNMVTSGYHYQYVKNTLHINSGFNSFSEIANLAQVDATDWSWGPIMCDFDQDGLKDLYIPNGYYRWLNVDERELYQAMRDATRRKDSATYNKLFKAVSKKKLMAVNYIFKNQNGYQFTREMENWGLNYPTITHGAAIADLDADGDMDIIMNNHEVPALICRNNQERFSNNNWVHFSLRGQPNNPDGIGAKIYIWSPLGLQMAQHHTVRGYQSASQNIVHFGMGKDQMIDRLVIVWPDGRTQQLTQLPVNRVYTLDYKQSTPEKFVFGKSVTQPLFTDATQKTKIDFVHTENEYEDFRKEILLPHKLSRYGPGLAVADVNGDGLEDFLVAGAARMSNALYLQQPNGTFSKAPAQPWENEKNAEILGVLFFDANGDSYPDLYCVSGGNEFKQNDPWLKDFLYLNDGKGNFRLAADALPDSRISGSCVVAGDYDSDGDWDLFVGGRVVPASYPLPAPSQILRNEGGRFTDVTNEVAPELEEAGLVCSALWTDYNNDGKTDLLVVGEWMPLVVFLNENGKLVNKTREAGIEHITGWWNSIVAADVDNDGDLDYIAGNEGLNSRYYQPKADEPVELYCADFDQNGTNDLLLSVYNFGKPYPVKTRLTMTEQVPSLGEKFPLYKQFALATTDQVFGKEALQKALHLKATDFHSGVFINNANGTFSFQPLPLQAQFSCMYGMVPLDVNQDGNVDLVAHGNFFSNETEVEKQDAFMGLTLLGDGTGKFTVMPLKESGFLNNKDGKALALIYVGKEKRPVILGTNNNDAMFAHELMHKPAVLELTYNDRYAELLLADGRKQRHEVHLGSGYMSQNSPRLAYNPAVVQKITVTDRSGNSRIAYENNAVATR
ncbi:MAG: FG-GAP-like repeat-containing protein [Chitinophagales bacterium]|nr:FG-GAP-like repeat-containing protein [Chitinophagales bacterium]MDW8393947.1 FG-GAP-like repeat-containing protein [Chitinophagales bacterium]